MTIARLELTDFTVFKRAAFEFCPGINVLMGENATGKTHVLKAMYAALRGSKAGTPDAFAVKFRRVFRPDSDNLARLTRRGGPAHWALQVRDSAAGAVSLDWHSKEDSWGRGRIINSLRAPPSLYVPPREVLAMYSGFVAAYEARELDFDETYYDICKALGAAPLRGARLAAVADLLTPLEKILGGKVILRGNHFFVQQGDAETEAHLLAEGLRKIAALAYLVANGTITRDSVVFWDEPEASLNPRLVVQVVEFVRALARAGVQVFLASHDFLLLHRLSQPAEHGLPPAVPIRFFSLYRPRPEAPVEVEAADTLADIEHNAILDEFARYYDDERMYTWRELAADAAPPVEPARVKKASAKMSTAKKSPAKKQTAEATRTRTAKKPAAKKSTGRTVKRG
ncbi:MAG TPA: AAA family ATPase [Nannocystis sp.]